MPALYAPPAPRTRTHLDAKRADDGAAHRQIVLILRDDVRLVHRAATGGTCPGQRRVVRPIDPPGHRTGAVSAAGGARASARQTAGALSMRFGERRGLPEARPARRVELILKSLVAPFQPIPLVLGARPHVAQPRDLLLLDALESSPRTRWTSSSARIGESGRTGWVAAGTQSLDERMIQKGTYGSSFRLRCCPFPEGRIAPERPQRRGGRSATSAPPPGPRIDDSGGVAQGFSYGHGHGHGSCKNLNNHRAKRGLLLQHRLQHRLQHQVE